MAIADNTGIPMLSTLSGPPPPNLIQAKPTPSTIHQTVAGGTGANHHDGAGIRRGFMTYFTRYASSGMDSVGVTWILGSLSLKLSYLPYLTFPYLVVPY